LCFLPDLPSFASRKLEATEDSASVLVMRGVYHPALFIFIYFAGCRINRSAWAGVVSANFLADLSWLLLATILRNTACTCQGLFFRLNVYNNIYLGT
jgi:hypothetical protein